MSGNLKIEVTHCDAQAAILKLTSKDEETGTRSDASLKIDYGRDAVIRLPEFLMSESEVSEATDSEPRDQKEERLAARIKTLEAQQHSALVANDETDHARMTELMSALHNERETTRSLQRVKQLVENEFLRYLDTLDEDGLAEVSQRHGQEQSDNPEESRGALRKAFQDGSISEKVDLYASAKAALDEEQTRAAAYKHHQSTQHNHQDKDARYSGDAYRGADSTTDLQDGSVTREGQEEEDFEESAEEHKGQRAINDDRSGKSSAGTPFGDSSDKGREQSEESHAETSDKAAELADEDSGEEQSDQGSSEDGDDAEAESNNPQQDEKKGQFPAAGTGGGSTEKSKLEDRPVDFSSEEEEGAEAQSDDASEVPDPEAFRSKVNDLKVAQLEEVESEHDLEGEGNKKARQDALKRKFEQADDDEKKDLYGSVCRVSEDDE